MKQKNYFATRQNKKKDNPGEKMRDINAFKTRLYAFQNAFKCVYNARFFPPGKTLKCN